MSAGRRRLQWGKRYRRGRFGIWVIPLMYVAGSLVLAVVVPRVDLRLPADVWADLDPASSTAFFAAIAGGTMALTGIVFSLIFILVQFGSTAYSPRLVVSLTRDPIVAHAIGVFTATFMYNLAAILQMGRFAGASVPPLTMLVAIIFILASVVLFIALIQRITTFQVTSVLQFVGDRGREVIGELYPEAFVAGSAAPMEFPGLPPVRQTLSYAGASAVVMEYDLKTLVELARSADAVVKMDFAVGDVVADGSPVLEVRGGRKAIAEDDLAAAVRLGLERTLEQDPKYAIRLIVDISIRALSPAINDPTTAVQGLDQLDDLLRRLGTRRLDVGSVSDASGTLRLLYPTPTWEDFLALAFDEIRYFGATSVQVTRRLGALLNDLQTLVPPSRRDAVAQHASRLDVSLNRTFVDEHDRSDARVFDRQGLGVARKRSE